MPTKRRNRATPLYPTRLEAEAQPQRLLPAAPTAITATLTRIGLAGGLLLLGLSACDRAPGTADIDKLDAEETLGQEKDIPPYAGSATVAPVFEHGDGRAATGCVVVAPPAFLSEEDARAVIREELEKQGIRLDQHDRIVKNISITKAEMGFQQEGDPRIPTTVRLRRADKQVTQPFNADLIDSAKQVVIEFLSSADYHDLGGRQSMSTVQSYDFKTVAKKVALQIEKQNRDPKRYFVVFYDPAAHMSRDGWPKNTGNLNEEERLRLWQQSHEKAEQNAKVASKDQLRQQVRDFAKWLKDKGVI